jgi:transcriptional regulator with XRE-family HTH domain
MQDETLTQAIARQVRQRREAQGWSLAALAAASGVSKAMISRIERGEASPTAALLARLSGAFGVTLSALLAVAEGGEHRLSRAAEQPLWTDPGTGYLRRVISPPAGAPLELIEVTLPAGARVPAPAAAYRFLHQQIWLLDGELRFDEGATTHRLQAGDCLQLGEPADCAFVNDSPRPCRYLVALIRR